MNPDPSSPESEVPRSEPEIIAPPRAGSRSPWDQAMRGASHRYGYRGVYVTRLGPSSLIILVLGVAFLAVCALFLLAGAILIWIPIAAVLLVGSVVAALLRRFLRH